MHLFTPGNPLLMLQSGMTYYKGRAGLQTQLTPIPPGYGTPSQNPSSYTGGPSPGYPNWDAPNSGPYTPPYPPWPQGFATPGLVSFNATLLFYAPGSEWLLSPVPPNASPGEGSVNSGGGTNGALIASMEIGGNGSWQFKMAAAKATFSASPFTQTGVFATLSYVDENGKVNEVSSSTATYSEPSSGTYWESEWVWTTEEHLLNDGTTYTGDFTVT